jgi:hypothetical protein
VDAHLQSSTRSSKIAAASAEVAATTKITTTAEVTATTAEITATGVTAIPAAKVTATAAIRGIVGAAEVAAGGRVFPADIGAGISAARIGGLSRRSIPCTAMPKPASAEDIVIEPTARHSAEQSP